MKIITCFKLVAEEQDIIIAADRSLNLDQAAIKISQFDLNAIEAAMQIAGDDDQVIALSVGGKALDNSKTRKDILSRGPGSLYLVKDAGLEHALSYETAQALAAAASKIGFDLLLCGDGSGDLYSQQVGLLVGEMLQLPTLNAVSHIRVEGGRVVVERTLEDEVEVFELQLPAVLCVTSDINTPKIPAMKAILGAGKKPVIQWGIEDIGWSAQNKRAELIGVRAPQPSERKRIIIDDESPEGIATLVEYLRKSLN